MPVTNDRRVFQHNPPTVSLVGFGGMSTLLSAAVFVNSKMPNMSISVESQDQRNV
jgi:hypothetical protein